MELAEPYRYGFKMTAIIENASKIPAITKKLIAKAKAEWKSLVEKVAKLKDEELTYANVVHPLEGSS